MAAPLITIGITAYNAQTSINQAVQSALAQEWPNKEIVVYDDASSDKTLQELQKFNNIIIIAGAENKGVAFARNQIIEHAHGDFVAFFDDDDISIPERLKLQYERIIRYEYEMPNKAPVICHAARLQSYPDGIRHYESTPGSDETIIAPHGVPMAQRILYGQPCKNGFGSAATCAQMARTVLYKTLGGFDTQFQRCEDTDFNIRLALAGGHFLGISTPLVQQTMTYGDEKTITMEERMMQQLLTKYQSFIEDYTDYSFCRRWIETKYDYLRGDKKSFIRKLAVLALSHPILTVQRLLWALPNRTSHKTQQKFYTGNAT